MKKKVLLISIFIIILSVGIFIALNKTAMQSFKGLFVKNEFNYSKTPFGDKDLSSLDIKLGDKYETMVSKLGKPINETVTYSPSLDGNLMDAEYPFGKVSLEEGSVDGKKEYYVYEIEITNEGYKGPREITIGEEVSSVVGKFPVKETNSFNKLRFLYGNEGEDRGYIEYNDNNDIINLNYVNGDVGYGSRYLYLSIKNNRVSKITLGVVII